MNEHVPVMVDEVVEGLGLYELRHFDKRSQKTIVDATVGAGGHALEVLKHNCYVIGIDADAKMIEIAESRLKKTNKNYKLVKSNFRDIDKVFSDLGIRSVFGVLLDLGVSTMHLKSPTRGFSFGKATAHLDMRLDPEGQNITAADLLNGLGRSELKNVFQVILRQGEASKLAKAIVEVRKIRPFKKVKDFLLVTNSLFKRSGKIDPSTRAFLALRIAVNSELESVGVVLKKAFGLLEHGGRLVVISFHSGEDMIVKRFFRKLELKGLAKVLTRKPMIAGKKEIDKNPSARSAKLRVLQKN